MSANMILQQQADDFAKLKALLAQADPAKIAAAEVETRKQMQLNAEETAKVSEAKSFIGKHESLKTHLQERENAVKDGEKANLEEAQRLAEWDKKLKAKAARLVAAAQSDD